MLFPRDADAPRVLGVVLDTFERAGGFDGLQHATFDAIAESIYATDAATLAPVSIEDARTLDESSRKQAVSLMVVFEYIEHPLRPAVSEAVEAAARALGVSIDHPFGALSFLALPVVPALRLTDLGLVDATRGQLVPLSAEASVT